MNRYFLFVYDNYYPSGGIHDFQESYASLEEAKAQMDPAYKEAAHIGYLEDDGSLKIILYWCTWTYEPQYTLVRGYWHEI